jgi:putative transposase
LHEERFCDQAPDEGQYLCSERTMYRILAENHEVRERRDQLRHPRYAPPELLATRPNEVWSWDITKLLGPSKWTYFYLYVILDIFSRYVVGWMVAYRESAVLAQRLIEQTIKRQDIEPGKLTLHADRGSSMTFGCLQDTRGFCGEFFHWYNCEHHHSGLGYLTPFAVHFGQAHQQREQRVVVLRRAFERNPGRFVRGVPQPPALPEQVWINKPKEVGLGNNIDVLGAADLPVDSMDLKNGFHKCPISNERKSGRDLSRSQNQVSDILAH